MDSPVYRALSWRPIPVSTKEFTSVQTAGVCFTTIDHQDTRSLYTYVHRTLHVLTASMEVEQTFKKRERKKQGIGCHLSSLSVLASIPNMFF